MNGGFVDNYMWQLGVSRIILATINHPRADHIQSVTTDALPSAVVCSGVCTYASEHKKQSTTLRELVPLLLPYVTCGCYHWQGQNDASRTSIFIHHSHRRTSIFLHQNDDASLTCLIVKNNCYPISMFDLLGVLPIKTSSLAKMDKLKLLQLKFVRLSGSYNNFPGLRWLCWHGCHLETIPSRLCMNSLVAIDMSYGILEKFEPPTVLNLLKILNLRCCYNLVSVCNLYRTPNLETLILQSCLNLTHLSKSIGRLESLTLLNLGSCKNLWKFSSNICIGGGIREHSLFSLPPSLKFLFLDYCNLENNSDLGVVLRAQSLFGMSLEANLFEFLPNKIQINILRVLNLTDCKNLKSLLCLPSTLEELYIDYCTSLEIITFQSACFRLRRIRYLGCSKLSEIQGLFKLVSIKKLDEAHMGKMEWIKAYEDFKVDLVDSIITEDRMWQGENEDTLIVFAKISNTTKGHLMQAQSWCGASLVYMDDGEVKHDNFENYTKEEEVIGGDLSKLQLKTGEYFLSRVDISDSTTTNWSKMLLGDDHTLHYT
ncbi:putative TIR domain, P-loop containing nucleoside triphosphate hydrolase, partial [Tanacetum coccineum]